MSRARGACAVAPIGPRDILDSAEGEGEQRNTFPAWPDAGNTDCVPIGLSIQDSSEQ